MNEDERRRASRHPSFSAALSLDLVAQDGTRVRASASAPSFRREASLGACREQAALHVKAVLAEADDPEPTTGEKAARLAAAMETDEAKETFRARAGLCELSNAHLKQHHGVVQVLVRGIDKVTCVALLAALAHNVLQHATHLLA